MSPPVIGFAGMTHLGVNSAAGALGRGFQVIGYDTDRDVIGKLKHDEPPVLEPGLPDALKAHAARSRFTSDIEELRRCDLVYVASDVPTDDAGVSDLRGIHELINKVASVLRPGAVLVVLCQVPPGFTRSLSIAPERVFYQVETLVFGRALERATQPERFIVGCADPSAPLPGVLKDYLSAFACPILYESAELAKIAINCCLVSSISVANTLAELCERVGAAWSEIVPALRLDRRIGPHAYLSPGLGIAGGNLERDLATVIRLADEKGTDAAVVRAWIANSRHRRDWAARTARHVVLRANPKAVLAVWGLAYKENTHSVKNSPSIATIAQLQDATLRVHDPVVPASALKHPTASAVREPLEALEGAQALLILTPWPQYKAFRAAQIAKAMSGRVVIDPYGILDLQQAAAAGLEVYTLGRSPLQPGRSKAHA
jgi:UDPglucose 6-dehydrogenase